MIDSHTHFLHRRFHEEEPPLTPEQILANATQAGVTHLIGIACRRDEWGPYLAFAQNHPHVAVAAGIHPQDVEEGALIQAEELQTLAQSPKVVALGETGLDYHYDTAPKTAQWQSFHTHLKVAEEQGLPAVIHTRDAEADTLQILSEHKAAFVLHCFTGSRDMAEKAVEQGGYISFSGILTFKKSQELRDIAAALPREKVLIETDAPYLAPEPFRGKRNQSSLLPHTAQMLASVWQLPLTETVKITVENTLRLFPRLSAA